MSDKKKPYSPPKLESHEVTVIGKHQTFDITASDEFEEPHDLKALLAEYGSPLFILSEQTLRGQFRSFRDAFTAPGMETRIAYSYKTNYLPAVCAVLHEEGALAEVVSGMEYDLARSLGVPGEDIVFNGPFKRPDELRAAISDGALVNVDGFDELETISGIASGLGRMARVGIRVNFKYGAEPWTKFGFNVENGDSLRALKIIAGDVNLDFEALHNHSGTFHVDPNVYAQAARVMIEEVKRAHKLGLRVKVLDFGGGYRSENKLKPMFDDPNGNAYKGTFLTRVAEAILNKVSKAKDLFEERPVIILEPGRVVVDSCMRLMSTVVATKELSNKRPAVVIDAGVNVLPTAYWYDYDMGQPPDPDVSPTGKIQPTTVFGPLCMQTDVIRDNVLLPPLNAGEMLSIANVGAYCLTQSMQFIQPRPAVVMLAKDGPHLIRRAETSRDIFALDYVPEHIRNPGGTF
jgi:diaminopimelate decarboxylase